MWPWFRTRTDVDARKEEAERALKQTERQIASSKQHVAALQRSAAVLRRLNQENGFAPRLEMAFRGEQ